MDDMAFYTYSRDVTTLLPHVNIPQNGHLGTFITFMGYTAITAESSAQYKLREHARSHGRYSIANPEYFALIDNRMVIATKPNIGNVFPVEIGDYLDVMFLAANGDINVYHCIAGEAKGSDATNPWGHEDGKSVVEMVYHDANPPEGYNPRINNPWGEGRVIRITKVGHYGNFE